MKTTLTFSFIACLLMLTGCDNTQTSVESESSISQLIDTNIQDRCVYQVLDPYNNLSFNTVRLFENFLGDELHTDKAYHVMSIEEGDDRLLTQAKALEKIGFVTKIADEIIKDEETGIYYDMSYFKLPLKNKNINKIKGQQFKLTLKGEEVIKRLYNSDNAIHLCIGNMGIGQINTVTLSDTKLKVLVEMEYTNSFDWVSNEDIVNAFGDLTEGVFDNALAGLIEAYLIKTKNGYILENNKLTTVK